MLAAALALSPSPFPMIDRLHGAALYWQGNRSNAFSLSFATDSETGSGAWPAWVSLCCGVRHGTAECGDDAMGGVRC